MFQKNPELFDIYHRGFASQVEKWPENPIDGFIRMLKSAKTPLKVADMGCGEAALAKALQDSPHTIYSFDLVARNSFIVACDIAHVPLAEGSVDVVIFSLSLMGTDVTNFLIEAVRILRKGGVLKIAEVKSRFEGDILDKFTAVLHSLGLKLLKHDDSNKMFFLLTYSKVQSVSKQIRKTLPMINLKPCQYKRR